MGLAPGVGVRDPAETHVSDHNERVGLHVDRGATSSLSVTVTGLIAAGGCVALLSWLSIRGGRYPGVAAAGVPTTRERDKALVDPTSRELHRHGDERNR